ncbi:MAG: hypothetical protein PHE16_05370 [Aliarcobacter sp.]|nr:hypothetical protein [Aliarcobacter sp.]
MSYSINQAELLIDNLLNYYNVSTYSDLGIKINVSQANISSWKIRNSVNAIKKKCKELGIYNEIFGDLNSNINNFQNSTNGIAQVFGEAKNEQIGNKSNIDENILKLIDTLYSFAKTNNKIDELKTDLSALLPKYM